MDLEAADALWAKFDRETGTTLPLAQHMRDSADVARRIWQDHLSPGVIKWFRNKTGLESNDLENLVAWIAGTHDIGKASVDFQTQIETQTHGSSVVARLARAGFRLPKLRQHGSKIPHSHFSCLVLTDHLANRYGLAHGSARQVASIAGAHHGIPTFDSDLSNARQAVNIEPRGWDDARERLLEMIITYTNAETALAQLRAGTFDVPAQLVLTGLVIESDWIASNTDYFPLDSVTADRLEFAWSRLSLPHGWHPPSSETTSAKDFFTSRFDWPPDRQPHAAQESVLSLVRDEEPPLIICLEAPMGAGKTESALAASEMLAKRWKRSGVFVAAPTMSTSDGLFRRVEEWGRRVTPENEVTSMYLGHSKNVLNDDFDALRRSHRGPSIGVDEYARSGQGDVTAHQWMSGRKKGILSDFVVGTVDQILFSALQSRHVMLRHLGLAQKVVIIDEVHAYDSYMQSYLSAALTWLGTYRVPVVLLSATLPPKIKLTLLEAYRQGLGPRARDSEPAADSPAASDDTYAYPLITSMNADGVIATTEVSQSSRTTDVRLEVIDDDVETLVEVLSPFKDQGGCVLVLCTTVNRAQEAFQALHNKFGDSAELLHAGFAATSRADHESHLREELGPTSRRSSGRPFRRLLVSTQVVEQSLDVDFDLIVTDFAPTDLLLQRIGRLHRHARPAADRPKWTAAPRTLIRGIASASRSEAPPEFSDAIPLIYSPYILLRSWWELRAHLSGTPLVLPDAIPRLVADTYASSTIVFPGHENIVAEAKTAHEEKLSESTKRARSFQLRHHPLLKTLSDAFGQSANDFERSGANSEPLGSAVVRDSIPSLEVVLVQRYGSGYRPIPGVLNKSRDTEYSPDQPPIAIDRALASCTVRLPYRFGREPLFSQALEELETKTYTGWKDSRFLDGMLTLELDEDLSTEVAGNELRYDLELGLIDVSASRYSQSQHTPNGGRSQ